ncbi:MAG: precorrin-2 C20-methyltransferase / precorrin-3B C17-methyltransferase [Frankiales bacterium]|nr:precorrin-2 C20-methyltransferase / precorrin-3B C17-methyltransferase [Frankiales bacterium]
MTLYGVGLGPGDPELVTVKAARILGEADVVAFHSARHGRSIALGIARTYLRDDVVEEHLVYPLTVETTDHPGGYRGALEEFYEECATRLAAHLDAGRDVVVLAEGDPMFYGSYMHLHKRLADRYPTVVVPGVTSVSASAAALGAPLVEGEEVLTVLPGTLPVEELTARLSLGGPAAVMKLGRTFDNVRAALEASGRLDEAFYVERASTDVQRTARLADVDPSSVPYFSMAVLPSSQHGALPVATAAEGRGSVVVVGLGPAGRDWQTPESMAALAQAEVLLGYGPYLDRVPPNSRQERIPSDNTEEDQRARHALDLARAGRRVAVVSSGDPGVFAMATAVWEAAADYPDVAVQTVPGLTAAQAVAARVGAPLGHDFCVLSLSDRLKSWETVSERLSLAAKADLVIAVYNPRSKARPWQVGAMQEIVLEHRSPATVVVLGRDVGGPTERVIVTTLGELDPDLVDMRTLVLIGSSTTRVLDRPDGTQAVFTPRRYPA